MVYKSTSIDELAAAMEEILNDKNYTSVFERPQIKTASAEEPKDENTIEHAYKQLVEASQILDELGLFKSSELALSAVETLLAEATGCCKPDCEKCTGDGDCKCCCASDSNDADDKKCCKPDCKKCSGDGECKCKCASDSSDADDKDDDDKKDDDKKDKRPDWLKEKGKTTDVKPGEDKPSK